MSEDFDPLAGMNTTTKPTAAQPFGMKERLIATLLFDTQPKRRAAFVKRLGYELNPKDDNEIKPIGSSDDEYFPIDPGGMFNLKQYLKGDGVSELGKDMIEGVADLLTGAGTEAVGDLAAIPGAAGGPVGALAGRSVGRMAAFNAIEAAKDKFGDMFLDEKVPIDVALRATQTGVQAIGPAILEKGGQALKKAASKTMSAVSSGVRNLLEIGDGKIGEQAWNALKKNPELIADEKALRSASGGIDSTIEHLLGMGDDGNSFGRSVFAEKMAPIEAARKAEAARLSTMPELGADLGNLTRFFEMKKMELADPTKYPIKGQSRKDAIAYIDEKIAELKDLAPKNGLAVAGQSPRLNFGQLDSVVKELQSDLYGPKLLQKDWRSAVRAIVDGTENSPGLNNYLKDESAKVGSNYGALKEQEGKMFQAYEKLNSVLGNNGREKAKRFVLGDHTADPRGTNTDTLARDFDEAMQATDGVLGTDFYNGIKTGQIQNQFWQQLHSKGATGSGNTTIPALVSGGTVGGALKAMGAPPELAMLAGTAATGLTYGLSKPKIGTRVAIGAESLAGKLAEDAPLGGYAAKLAPQLATQDINRRIPPMEAQPTPEPQFDPLEDFDPLKDFGK